MDEHSNNNSNVMWKETDKIIPPSDKVTQNIKKSKPTWKLIALILILVIGGLYFGKFTGHATLDETLAIVNDVSITSSELDKEYSLFFLITGYPKEFENIITKEIYLNQSIIQILLYEEAQKKNIVVTNNEVDEILEEIIDGQQISKEEFETQIKEIGLKITEMKDYLKKQMTVNMFIEKEVKDKINITEDELIEYYNLNIENFDLPEQVRAAHILICSKDKTGCVDELTKEEAISKVNDLKLQIKNGANFSELASEFSIDGSRFNGGDLGFFVKSEDNDGSMPSMVTEFEEASFNLKINEVSDVVETMYGFHLIKLLDHRNAGIREFSIVKDEISDNIKEEKTKEMINSLIEELLNNNEIKVN